MAKRNTTRDVMAVMSVYVRVYIRTCIYIRVRVYIHVHVHVYKIWNDVIIHHMTQRCALIRVYRRCYATDKNAVLLSRPGLC